MSEDRLKFESAFPVPGGVAWRDDALGLSYFPHDGEYHPKPSHSHRTQRRNALRANGQNKAYAVWRFRNDEIAELKYQLKISTGANQ